MSNTKNKPSAPKRFHYNAPKKKETLPEQWSSEFPSKHGQSNAPQIGFGLEDAWSIRRNVSVGHSKTHTSSTTVKNSMYSRHKALGAGKSDTFHANNRSTGHLTLQPLVSKGVTSYPGTGILVAQQSRSTKPQNSNGSLQYMKSFGSAIPDRSLDAGLSCQITSCASNIAEKNSSNSQRFDSSSESPFDF